MDQSERLFLHEEVMLLCLRDREGTIEFGANYRHALAGAIVAELLLGGRVRAEEKGKKKLAEVVDAEPFDEPVLDDCLLELASATKPREFSSWVAKLANLKDLRHRIAEGLCRRDILRADADKVMLLFTRKIYPEVDPLPEQMIIERLRQVIFTDSSDVEPRTLVLLSLAKGADLLKLVFDRKALKSRADRIEQIVNGEIAGKATGEAIQAMQAALFVAVIVPTIITTTVH